ncbi:hypothetical protein [Dethiobacter alkaliphilus]|nr:hypothetical protein [Dethiobacter alkaliphilus]MCW3491074.1 hypothetical protein [Dethiobacter alkaliphilus]
MKKEEKLALWTFFKASFTDEIILNGSDKKGTRKGVPLSLHRWR